MLYLRGFYLSQSKVKLFASEKSHIFLIVQPSSSEAASGTMNTSAVFCRPGTGAGEGAQRTQNCSEVGKLSQSGGRSAEHNISSPPLQTPRTSPARGLTNDLCSCCALVLGTWENFSYKMMFLKDTMDCEGVLRQGHGLSLSSVLHRTITPCPHSWLLDSITLHPSPPDTGQDPQDAWPMVTNDHNSPAIKTIINTLDTFL